MRKYISAHFVTSFAVPAVSILSGAFVSFALLLICLLTPSASNAQTPIITATAYENPAQESLDTATSYLVINFNNGPGGTNNPASNYLFQYNWNPGTTENGWDLVTAFFQSETSPSLVSGTVDATYYSLFDEHYIDGFTLNGNTEDDNVNLNGDYWNYFQAGTPNSSVNPNAPPTLDDTLSSAVAGVWTSAGSGPDDFTLTSGSVDGYEWGGLDANYNPLSQPIVPTAPAPEASSILSMAFGLVSLCAAMFVGPLRNRRFKMSR